MIGKEWTKMRGSIWPINHRLWELDNLIEWSFFFIGDCRKRQRAEGGHPKSHQLICNENPMLDFCRNTKLTENYVNSKFIVDTSRSRNSFSFSHKNENFPNCRFVRGLIFIWCDLGGDAWNPWIILHTPSRYAVSHASFMAHNHPPKMEALLAKLMFEKGINIRTRRSNFWCFSRLDCGPIYNHLFADCSALICGWMCIYMFVGSILKYRIAFRLSVDPFYFNLLIWCSHWNFDYIFFSLFFFYSFAVDGYWIDCTKIH